MSFPWPITFINLKIRWYWIQKKGLKFVISHLCQIGGRSHTGVTRWSILCKKDLCTAKRFGFHSNKTFPAFWKTAAALRRNGSRGKRGWRGVFKNTENSSIVNQILECSNFSSKTNWMLIDDKDNNWISLKTILNHDQLKVFKIWNFKWCYVEWHNLLNKSYFQTQFHLKKNSNLATWLG